MIYFDNAATTWPKPPGVSTAMVRFMEEVGSNLGRAGHRLAVEAGRIVYAARQAIANLFHVGDPMRVVFGANVTEALNLALHSLLRPGELVITSSVEHNSVMRLLRALEARGVEVTVVACSPEGMLDPAQVEAAIRRHTPMIVLTHASNVVGTLLLVAEVGRIAGRHGLLFLVDAAQTAGAFPLDEVMLTQRLIDSLLAIGGVRVYGGRVAARQMATVSFRTDGMPPDEIGLRLDEEYGILCRVGLHCSPAAHRTIGSFPAGTVRFGLGAMNTADEVDAALAAVERLAGGTP